MKRFLAPILLLVLLFPSLVYGVTMNDLVITNGLYFKKFTDVPFTGKVTGKKQGSFRSGKKDGVWVEYDRNGRVDKKVTYKNGKEDTYVKYRYRISGQLSEKGTYKDGKKHGPWLSYHDNGQLAVKGTHKDGMVDGPWVSYHDNGQLQAKGTYKEGFWNRVGPWVSYRKDGTLDEENTGTYKNGEKIK